MTTRTNMHIVTFAKPFTIRGVGEELAAGTYRIYTNEEFLETLSFPHYRRVSTQIELPPTFSHPNWGQLLEISPEDLATALARDRGDPATNATPQATPKRTIFGLAAELKNLIRRDRLNRAKQKDRS